MHRSNSELEADLGLLEQLDSCRAVAKSLHEEGLQSLASHLRAWFNGHDTHSAVEWAPIDTEPDDYINPALALRALSTARPVPADIERHLLSRIDALTLTELTPLPTPGRAKNVPVLQAARVLDALANRNGHGLGRPALLCLYRLLLELNTVTAPDWTAGSARATQNGQPSAFMTAEAARSTVALIEALRASASQFRTLATYFGRLSRMHRNRHLPEDWVVAESRKLFLTAYCSLAQDGRRSALPIDLAALLDQDKACNDLISDVANALERSLRTIATTVQDALSEVDETARSVHSHKRAADPFAARSFEYAHQTARDAIHAFHEGAKAGIEHLVALQQDGEPSTFLDRTPLELELVSTRFDSLADGLRRLLAPTAATAARMTDRELAAVSSDATQHWNPSELVAAASALLSLGGDSDDPRLSAAQEALEQSLSFDGSYPSQKTIDTSPSGYSLTVLGSDVVRSFALLFTRAAHGPSLRVARSLLRHFQRTAVQQLANPPKLIGWSHDHPGAPRAATAWTSSLALVALSSYIEMIEGTLNRTVCTHFLSRSAEDLEQGPSLDDLFVPDYGLAWCAPARTDAIEVQEALKKSAGGALEGIVEERGDSLAYYLIRMQAHVSGLTPPPDIRGSCYSAVLYGPPGTGKTTLLEALAASSGCSLVEVTPSDIMLSGQHDIERRARVVFKALSLLTSTVILLDEFDPVLLARRPGREPSSFSFLTPGLLPKLKHLNAEAQRRRCAFALLTNHIGLLDEAAIRTGRFDYKIGVFPPDLLSRAGQLASALADAESEPNAIPVDWDRAAAVVLASRDAGMQTLATPGNFLSYKRLASTLDPDSILARVQEDAQDGARGGWAPGPPDAIPLEFPEASSPFAVQEFRQWAWIREWDEKAADRAPTEFQWSDLLKACKNAPHSLFLDLPTNPRGS